MFTIQPHPQRLQRESENIKTQQLKVKIIIVSCQHRPISRYSRMMSPYLTYSRKKSFKNLSGISSQTVLLLRRGCGTFLPRASRNQHQAESLALMTRCAFCIASQETMLTMVDPGGESISIRTSRSMLRINGQREPLSFSAKILRVLSAMM